jgi:hypothetical protein
MEEPMEPMFEEGASEEGFGVEWVWWAKLLMGAGSTLGAYILLAVRPVREWLLRRVDVLLRP